MSKPIVTRLFIGGGLAVIAGAILGVAAVWTAVATGTFVMNGSDIVGLRGSALAWSMLGIGIVGGLTILGGLIAGLVAWIGALLNTWHLDSKAWFIALLVIGIFNLGFFAMIAYVVAGPDGRNTAPSTRQTRSPGHDWGRRGITNDG
jgi:MFS family permease